MTNIFGLGGVDFSVDVARNGYGGVGCYPVSESDLLLIRQSKPTGATYFIRNLGSWVFYLRYRESKGVGAWVSYDYGRKWSVSFQHLSSLGKLHSIYPDSNLWGYSK